MARLPAGPVPTLGDLDKLFGWCWVECNNPKCRHRVPVKFAPLIKRYGADASSNVLRQNATCSKCKGRGATLTMPSWGGNSDVGFSPFPEEPSSQPDNKGDAG